MNGQLQDKVAIVTGGGTGIGEAICRTFAREGARVVVNGLPEDPIQDVVMAILDDEGTAIPFAGDASVATEAKACVDAALEAYGRLDVLINNAGVLLVGAETDKMQLDKFDEHIRCNIRTAFLMTKYALPHLRKTRGNIISAGSAAGINGEPGATAYGGTKGFLHAFMAGVAVEQAKYGVRANCVCPGPIAVPYVSGEPPRRMTDPDVVPFMPGTAGIRFSPSRIFNAEAFTSGGAGMAGTARDFQKLLTALQSDGAPVLNTETARQMRSNQIGALRLTSVQQPAWGFGFGGALLMDSVASGTPQAAGTWQWGGVYGHHWYVDSVNQLTVIAMTNTALEGMVGGFVVELMEAVYGG
jgi:NAD(P)-dependent dehydrogenase (short-subunit alcohol dehydrogenase family)